jgi:hypothetical protein
MFQFPLMVSEDSQIKVAMAPLSYLGQAQAAKVP